MAEKTRKYRVICSHFRRNVRRFFTHRDHFGTPAYVKDKFMYMSEIRTEGTNGYQVVFANEVFHTLDESNAYWEKMYALYEEGKIDPNGENDTICISERLQESLMPPWVLSIFSLRSIRKVLHNFKKFIKMLIK